MNITFFETPNEFYEWLKVHHQKEDELVVGYYKKATGIPTITWEESVVEALKFGWIDGIRRKNDEESYTVRFTPRRPNSVWSQKNVDIVKELIEQGLMEKKGLEAYQKLKKEKVYSFERDDIKFTKIQLQTFKKNTKAWEFFQSQPPGYKKLATYWVTTAKREETQKKRLNQLIEDSENYLRIKQFRR